MACLVLKNVLVELKSLSAEKGRCSTEMPDLQEDGADIGRAAAIPTKLHKTEATAKNFIVKNR